MKILIGIMLLLLPVAAAAQNPAGNQQLDMGKLMEAMQKMQECMAQIDPAELKALEASGDKMDAEIKALCAEGKRDEAQDRAMAYGKEMMKNPAMMQMKKCGEITKDLMPEGATPSMEDQFDFSKDSGHVCDEE